MLRSHRTPLVLALLALLACCFLYAYAGVPKPPADWKWIDIASEAGISLMAGVWLVLVLSSRPPGRVTSLLAAGLAGLMLGACADCLDEFFSVPKGQLWNHALESGLTLAGMAALTCGLLDWRREQFMLNEHLHKRERLFRDHRSFDPLTQVGDADYLRAQLRIEYERGTGPDCCLLMVDIDSFHLINRAHGQREGDRLLQAVTHTLLLNVRRTDLLCRYAGDRFAVLLPTTDGDTARALAEQLRRAVATLRHHSHACGDPLQVTLRYAVRHVDIEPRQLLKEINRALERRMPQAAPAAEDGGALAARA
jgi:diguanylate cyclase (GGDEF)-like protein